MTTPVQQKLRDKKRTPAQVIDMVKPGSWINPGSIGGDATACVEELAGRLGPGSGQLHDVELWSYGAGYPQPCLEAADSEERYHCLHEFFFSPWNRRRRERHGVTSWAQWGWTLGTWWHHYRFAAGTYAFAGPRTKSR